MKFCIKNNYIHRDEPEYFDDTCNTDEWQNEVYHLAYTLSKIISKKPVLDIGCGSGYKLISIFHDMDTIGIEVEKTYQFLIQKYPDKTWKKVGTKLDQDFGVVILSDVIEHVKNPDEILNFLRDIKFDILVISTPYRDSIALCQTGPPKNISHAREWSFNEFREYIGSKFEIINHFLINKSQHTQCIICKKYG